MTDTNAASEPHDDLLAARAAFREAQAALKSAQAALRKAERAAEPPPVHAEQQTAERETLTPERMRSKHAALVEIEQSLYWTARGAQKIHGTIAPPHSLKAEARLDYAESLRHYVYMDPEQLYREGDPDNNRWALRQILRSGTDAGYIGANQCWQAW